MELALAALLVSSFTCVGVLALWAATSPRHWFVRVGVFLATISLSLVIPAYEIFIALLVQGMVVGNGVAIDRYLMTGKRANLSRFGLADLLLLTACASVLFAVHPRLPELNHAVWVNVVTLGAVMGLASFLGWWMALGRVELRWLRQLVGIVLTCILAITLISIDRFFVSVVSQGMAVSWPPEPILAPITGILGGPQEGDVMWAWVGVTGAVVLLSALAGLAFATISQHKPCRRAFQVVACGSLLLIAAPAAIVFGCLAIPLPIPELDFPTDNGYDDLVAAGTLTEKWDFNNNMDGYAFATKQDLRAAVDEMATAYDLLALAFSKPIKIPVDYTSTDSIGVDGLMNVRAVARICGGRGKLAHLENRVDDAMNSYLDAIRLGAVVREDALMVHALVGFGCAATGRLGIYELRGQLTAQQCLEAIQQLTRLDLQPGEAEGFVERDRIWTQHAMGWHGRLTQLLSDWFQPEWGFTEGGFLDVCRSQQAETRLLCVELALQAFHQDRETYPGQLEELVPKYLTSVPVDPFSTRLEPMRYRNEGNAYTLYSLGSDRDDDGGSEAGDDEAAITTLWTSADGDLQLRIKYAPPVEETSTSQSNEYGGDFSEPDQ